MKSEPNSGTRKFFALLALGVAGYAGWFIGHGHNNVSTNSREITDQEKRAIYLEMDSKRRTEAYAPENEIAQMIYGIRKDLTSASARKTLFDAVYLISPDYAIRVGINPIPLPGKSLEQAVIQQIHPIGNKIMELEYQKSVLSPLSPEEIRFYNTELDRLRNDYLASENNNALSNVGGN